MDNEGMLQALKTDLGITTDAYDTRLTQYLVSARKAIQTEGITLTESIADQDLVIRYAGWIWRKRSTGDGIPRSLRWALNNRLFSEKISGAPEEES